MMDTFVSFQQMFIKMQLNILLYIISCFFRLAEYIKYQSWLLHVKIIYFMKQNLEAFLSIFSGAMMMWCRVRAVA